MKVLLKSIGGVKLECEVPIDGNINDLFNALLVNNIVTIEKQEPKFIFKGKTMELTELFEKYGINEGDTIIFVPSKQNRDPSPPRQQVVQQQVVQQQAMQQQHLPNSFNGIHIDELRRLLTHGAITRVMNDRDLFVQVVLGLPAIDTIRDHNSQEFDRIIRHPEFLKHMMLQFTGFNNGNDQEEIIEDDDPDEENGDNDEDGEDDDDGDDGDEEEEGGELDDSNITETITEDEMTYLRNIIRQMKELGQHISTVEICKLFIACDKNKETMLEMLLN